MMNCWSASNEVDGEYEELVLRMNPPRVSVDNSTNERATLIKVASANKHGSLLQILQALIDMNLTIKKAYIASDGQWVMDVFHVVDEEGNKLYHSEVTERIQQSLSSRAFSCLSTTKRSVEIQASATHTSIELTGRDRPGLLSEIFALLTELKCNIVASQVWTHNSRMASVIYITDQTTKGPIDDDGDRLAKIQNLFPHVLNGRSKEKLQSARITGVSVGTTHMERRLHQLMYEDRDYGDYGRNDLEKGEEEKMKAVVTVENCAENGYTVVCVRSKDRPKLLFDTVCTLTDMQYVVFHASVMAEGSEAYQEYYIKHVDGGPVSFDGEKERLINCLEAAIKRRSTEGLKLELRSEDRIGLLSDLTRIFRENGLSITRAEVSTRESQVLSVFYVTDASGNPVQNQTVEALRNQIGESVLSVKDNDQFSKSICKERRRFSFGNLFKFRFSKLFFSLGLIRSSS